MDDTFTCDHCNGTFSKGWSDEEAAAESQSIWGDLEEDDKALVCDDCWQKIRPDREPEPSIRDVWERARAEWQEHSGRRLPPVKTSAQIIDEAVRDALKS